MKIMRAVGAVLMAVGVIALCAGLYNQGYKAGQKEEWGKTHCKNPGCEFTKTQCECGELMIIKTSIEIPWAKGEPR